MRRKLSIIALILLLISASTLYFANIIRVAGPGLFTEATFIVPCNSQVVGLTIDDGPDPVSTPRILDVLKDNGVKATFFIVGVRGEKNKALLKRIVEEGHELANHTYTETVTIALSETELKQSIKQTHDILSEFQPVRWFRPGTVFYNSDIVEAIKSYGYQIVLGDVFPFDTITYSSRFHAWYIQRSVQPGSIVIMHDARERGMNTARSLAIVLPKLKSMGYRVTSFGELKAGCEQDA